MPYPYSIVLKPLNSSGDVYHISAATILLHAAELPLPEKIVIAYSKKNPEHAKRTQMFLQNIPITQDLCELKATEHNLDKLPWQDEETWQLDQKASTLIIAILFLQLGPKTARDIITQYWLPPQASHPTYKDEIKVANELLKKWEAKHDDENHWIIFQDRYSNQANNNQCLKNKERKYLKNILSAYHILRIVVGTQTNPKEANTLFPHTIEIFQSNKAGKITHLSFFQQMFTKHREKIKAIIGGTSGLLDAIALISPVPVYSVYRLKQCTRRLSQQLQRLIWQWPFIASGPALNTGQGKTSLEQWITNLTNPSKPVIIKTAALPEELPPCAKLYRPNHPTRPLSSVLSFKKMPPEDFLKKTNEMRQH